MEIKLDTRKIITAEAKRGIISKIKNSYFRYIGWPTVCRDENGVLYAVASGFRIGHADPFGKTVMYISRNNGKTWTPPMVINDTYLDDRDAGILYLGNGCMLVTWFCAPNERYLAYEVGKTVPEVADAIAGMMKSVTYIPEDYPKGGSFVRISEDYGVTWSETIRVPISAPHGPNLLRDGSIIYLGKDMYPEHIKLTSEDILRAPDEYMKGKIRALKSVDGGHSWEELCVLKIPDGTSIESFHEPHVIELPDGRLLGVIRFQEDGGKGLTMYKTFSDNGGKNWSEMKKIDVCGAPPHLMLHSSGALICSYSRREKPFGARALVSYDFGETWSEDYIIDIGDNDNLGYPSSVELDDGSILTVYYKNYEGEHGASLHWINWKLKK